MKNKSCPNKIACYDYDASNCEECAVGNLILRQKKSIKRLKFELERHKRALLLLAKAFVELKGYKPFEVSQLAKEITVPEFLQQADREIEEERK